MSITTKLNAAERREKTKELYEEHVWKFEILKEQDPLFIPKSAYIPRGKDEKYIGFFPSELIQGKDIYTEFTSYDLSSEDPSRTLYKYTYNPYFEEEYEKTDGVNFRYLVPIKELTPIIINNPSDVDDEEEESDSGFPDFNLLGDKDCKITDMTLKDFAAIMLKKPVSDKEWLNKLIKD